MQGDTEQLLDELLFASGSVDSVTKKFVPVPGEKRYWYDSIHVIYTGIVTTCSYIYIVHHAYI